MAPVCFSPTLLLLLFSCRRPPLSSPSLRKSFAVCELYLGNSTLAVAAIFPGSRGRDSLVYEKDEKCAVTRCRRQLSRAHPHATARPSIRPSFVNLHPFLFCPSVHAPRRFVEFGPHFFSCGGLRDYSVTTKEKDSWRLPRLGPGGCNGFTRASLGVFLNQVCGIGIQLPAAQCALFRFQFPAQSDSLPEISDN